MNAITVSIVRWVDDEPQPGIVECKLTDRFGKGWTFIEKSAVVSAAALGSDSAYPQPRLIGCHLITTGLDDSGREFVVVDTELPWGIEADDGTTRFEVFADQLQT
jgi:hypothetical protein